MSGHFGCWGFSHAMCWKLVDSGHSWAVEPGKSYDWD